MHLMHHEKTSHDGRPRRPRRATPLQKLPAVGRMPSSSPLWRPQLLEFLRRRKKFEKSSLLENHKDIKHLNIP